MEYFEKLCTIITNTAGQFASLRTITANITALLSVIALRNTISAFCVTLHTMNDTVASIIFWLSIITAYGIIYRCISAAFDAVALHWRKHKAKINAANEHARLIQAVSALSNQEIACLNFLLNQPHCTAWLPDNSLTVILLEGKHIICNLDASRSKLADVWLDNTRGVVCSPFTIPENILQIISQLPQETIARWNNIPPDRTLASLQ